jgi:hypothetical protein
MELEAILETIFSQYGVMALYVVLFAVIFAESALFFGFSARDSLLLTVGYLPISIRIVSTCGFIAAVVCGGGAG